VDVACSAEGDEERFWELLDERCELCHKALRIRHETLLGTPSDVAPILWQYGAISRLSKGEKIDRLLYDNYSTISLGYAGLCECVYRMMGCSHTDSKGHDFGVKVMEFLNKKTAQWRAAENISYSLYGTPMESSTYKFAKCLQRRFGTGAFSRRRHQLRGGAEPTEQYPGCAGGHEIHLRPHHVCGAEHEI